MPFAELVDKYRIETLLVQDRKHGEDNLKRRSVRESSNGRNNARYDI